MSSATVASARSRISRDEGIARGIQAEARGRRRSRRGGLKSNNFSFSRGSAHGVLSVAPDAGGGARPRAPARVRHAPRRTARAFATHRRTAQGGVAGAEHGPPSAPAPSAPRRSDVRSQAASRAPAAAMNRPDTARSARSGRDRARRRRRPRVPTSWVRPTRERVSGGAWRTRARAARPRALPPRVWATLKEDPWS